MLMPVLSGLIVSVDAFFIGLSLGLQKKFKFIYLAVINAFLLSLCLFGFFITERLHEFIAIKSFDTDLIVGFSFIGLGLWCVLQYFISGYVKRRKGDKWDTGEANTSFKTFVIVGLVMSAEAMLITIGISFIFLPHSTIVIPLTVAFAHFGYSALSFFLARTKYAKRIPAALSNVISGCALIIYGLMALFVELEV